MQFPKLPKLSWPAPREKEPRAQLPWLVSVPAAATLLAAGTEWIWACLFCIEATGCLNWNWDAAAGSDARGQNKWDFHFSSHIPVLFGLLCATVPIVLWSMIWLPAQMEARGTGRWRRVSMIGAGLLCNALVIVSGTVVMNANRQDHVRANLVVEQSAEQGVAAIGARLDFAKTELARLTDPALTTYQAQAARDGATAWKARTAIAAHLTPPDPQLNMIAKAQASAEAADALRTKIEALTVAKATAAPVAATQANVRDDVGAGMNTFAQYADAYRPPFVAFTCTLIGIFGAFWLVGLLRQIAEQEPALPIMIEDHTDAPLSNVQPMTEAKAKSQRVWDNDEQVWKYKRRESFARAPTRKSGRKVPDAKGELVQDETDYETGKPWPEMEWPGGVVETGDAQLVQEAPVNDDVEPHHNDQRSDATDDAGRARDIRPGDVGNDDGARSDVNDPEQDRASPEAPQILAPAEFDRLVADGVIAADGTPLPQTKKEVIEQAQNEPRWPALAAPVSEMADAK